ncbi:hypothetical protein N7519_011199 [Penicillium mononematosum]|uniref:uncharacterized protein n=1 Tax=Penicillium mononematosum TaxID=268346 RepID=UPI0025479EB7|nr:uncharacterized protein N7519_011199 [Penicillium mononematosum]KAJ6180738.1 hypothetical protein N7519_011199 [Penicillium mononematosum]
MARSILAFFLVLAAMAAYWHTDLIELVGSVVVGAIVLVVGTCYFSREKCSFLQKAMPNLRIVAEN